MSHDVSPGVAADQVLYDGVAGAAAAEVIRGYSSSFGMSSRLLRQPVRDHVRNVYALVRLADEVVDGPMALARPGRAGELLDRLEAETLETLGDGYSTNLVVHAFTGTARACGIGSDLVTPFFASMRADLTVREHDDASFERYVYGSAEVVGLMCLRVFLAAEEVDRYDALAPGARRLGAAFQKVNFLRDLAADSDDLGRSYFPGLDVARFDERDRDRLLDDIDADLAAAAAVVHRLPTGSRRAVSAAHALFAELSRRLRHTSPAEIRRNRIRVPGPRKAQVIARAVARGVS